LSDIYTTRSALLLSTNQDKVPLGQLVLSDLLLQSQISPIHIHFIAFLVKIQVHTLTVVHELLRERNNNGLSGRDPERPFASSVLNEDGSESFNRTQDSSVNDHWSFEPILDMVLFPPELIIVILIFLIQLIVDRIRGF